MVSIKEAAAAGCCGVFHLSRWGEGGDGCSFSSCWPKEVLGAPLGEEVGLLQGSEGLLGDIKPRKEVLQIGCHRRVGEAPPSCCCSRSSSRCSCWDSL